MAASKVVSKDEEMAVRTAGARAELKAASMVETMALWRAVRKAAQKAAGWVGY